MVGPGDGPGALEDAVAEAWTGCTAREPIWTGAGTDLLTGTLVHTSGPMASTIHRCSTYRCRR